MSGKGDKPRPYSVTQEIYVLRYQLAFGTDEEKEDAKARLEFLEWEKGEEEK